MIAEEPEFTGEQLVKCRELALRSRHKADEFEAHFKIFLDKLELVRTRRLPPGVTVEAIDQARPGYAALHEDTNDKIDKTVQDGRKLVAQHQRMSARARIQERLYLALSAPGTPREQQLELWRQLGEPDLDHPTINVD